MQATYAYYAFISYSRQDVKAAKFLQRGLEQFKYAVFPVPEERKPQDPVYLRKVFRDKTDLGYKNKTFRDGLYRALADSRFLIVLCSPQSCRSPEVAREIEDFLAIPGHDEEHVLPIVLEGHVGKHDDPLPERLRTGEFTLRNIPTMAPEEEESVKESRENGLVGLIAAMTQVERETVNNRFLRDKRRQAIRLVQAGAAVAAALAGLTAWAIHERSRAEAARDKALALFEAGKVFSNHIIFEFNDQLVNLPQASTLQLQLVSSTFDYLNRLDKQAAHDPGLQRLISVAENQLGDVSLIRGKTTEACALYTEAHAIAQKLADANPNDAQTQRDLSVSYNKLGNIFVRLGKLDDALTSFNNDLAIAQKLADDNPNDAQAQDDWRISFCKLAVLSETKGDGASAIRHLKQALSISEKLAQLSPQNVRYQEILEIIQKELERLRAAQP